MPQKLNSSPIIFLTTYLLLCSTFARPAVEKTFRCPCSLSVSRTRHRSSDVEKQPLELLISKLQSSQQSTANNQKLSTFSRTILAITNATNSDALFHHFHNIRISDTGLFRVALQHESSTLPDGPRFLLQMRPTSRQQVCPIMIDQDIPSPTISYSAERLLQKRKMQDLASKIYGSSSPRSSSGGSKLTFNQHIVGGLVITNALMPYLVNIFNPSGATICSGTLLSANWVLTAAHCELSTHSNVYVMSSQIHFSSANDGRPIRVKRIIRHPEFEVGSTGADPNDVALLELKQSVDRFNVSYMPINSNASIVSEGAYARLTGYGGISYDESIPDPAPWSLRQVDVPVTNFRECRKTYRKDLELPIILSKKHHFCAGYLNGGGCNGCGGDSGGAVIMYHKEQPVLVGVHTGGVSCGGEGIPDVNVNIATHKDWLRSSGADFVEFKSRIHVVVSHCRKGEKLKAQRRTIASCRRCPINSVSDGGATLKCTRCPDTMVQDPGDPSSCSCSGLKGRGLKKNGRCEKCSKGSYSGVGDKRCRKCQPGSYSPLHGRAACKKCSGAPKGATSCST